MDWRELNMAVSKAMQNYCGGVKCRALLEEGIALLDSYVKEALPMVKADNPHELMRAHEVSDILEVAGMILQACLFRESSSKPLCFERSDSTKRDPEEENCFITIRMENGKAVKGKVPLGYFGDLETEYERRNQDYINSL